MRFTINPKSSLVELTSASVPPLIAVVGLGYVGLPLLLEFSSHYKVIGFDKSHSRISELKNGVDVNEENNLSAYPSLDNIYFTSDTKELSEADIFIVAVPTPVGPDKTPDLTSLKSACNTIKTFVKEGKLVVFESTVYPGLTEEVCVSIFEEIGVKLNEDFIVGYSPERINPGDTNHTLRKVVKVISGSNCYATEVVKNLYSCVVDAGVFVADSIKVAEMAKVIENIQRDVNIALVNEIALICKELNISHKAVLKAASTKWNFLPFQPGMVGGHCIGVDPYYLLHKSNEIGFNPQLITAGRNLNDRMSKLVAAEIETLALSGDNKGRAEEKKLLIFGAAFKENCNDIRNSKAIEVAGLLRDHGFNVEIFDPLVKQINVLEGGINVHHEVSCIPIACFDLIAGIVPHDEFSSFTYEKVEAFGKPNFKIYDFNNVFNFSEVHERF